MVCYATAVMVYKIGFMGMKLTCPGFFLEGPRGNAEWESRENGPLSNQAIQKVLWFKLLSQGHWPSYLVASCLESRVRAQWCCLSSSHWAFQLASNVMLDVTFYILMSFCLTGNTPNFIHTSPHLRRNFKICFFSLFLVSATVSCLD